MVDKIIRRSDTGILGLKNVTMNEPFFQGHFPNNPVMPGVLQIEAMAQVGGIFALSGVDNPEQWSTYFMKIDNVRFKQKVIPGDTILFQLELASPIRRGLVHMTGKAYVGGKLVSEAEMLAQIIPGPRPHPRIRLNMLTPSEGISEMAVVHPDAKVGEGVTISPFTTIAADVEIGPGTLDWPQRHHP